MAISIYDIAQYIESRGHERSQDPLHDAQAGITVIVLVRNYSDAKFYQRQVYLFAQKEGVEIKATYNLRVKFAGGGAIIIVPASTYKDTLEVTSFLARDTRYYIQG